MQNFAYYIKVIQIELVILLWYTYLYGDRSLTVRAQSFAEFGYLTFKIIYPKIDI